MASTDCRFVMELPDNLPNAFFRSPQMAYWLMKSEPDELSIKGLEKSAGERCFTCAHIP